MKRTRETIFKDHPEWMKRQGISGLRNFDGEDRGQTIIQQIALLDYESRKEYNKQKQKEWLEAKIKENQLQKLREKQEQHDYAQQTLELNRMRGMLEDKFLEKKKLMKISEADQNLKLAKEKKDKELFLKQKKLNFEKEEVRKTIENGTKLQFQGYTNF